MDWVVSRLSFQPPPPSYDSTKGIVVAGSTNILHVNHGFANDETVECNVVFVYSHGNAEDLGICGRRVAMYAKALNAEFVAYDYTGYGPDQTEQPSEEACYRNIQDVIDYLKACGIETERIILFGRSLGSGPTCHIASLYEFAGIVLDSPFTSPIRTKLPFTIPFMDIFDNLSKIESTAAPVMIIHGDQDQVVPYRHGVELFTSLQEERQYKFITVTGAGHNNLFENIATLHSFLEDLKEFAAKQKCTRHTR